MRVHIGSKVYDTEEARNLATHRTASSHQELLQTSEGDFFLFVHEVYVDGKKLGPHDTWIDLRHRRQSDSRIHCRHGIRPLGHHEALEWCIKTQIPETFRGLLLESI